MRKKKTYGKSSFLLTVLLLVYIFPFFLVLINSFKSKRDVVKNPLSLIGEEGFCPENYLLALKRMDFWNVFLNSLLITVVSVLLIVLFSSMTAYLFARCKWKINKLFFSLMILSMVIPFQVLMIPIVSVYGSVLHVLNSRLTLICMHVGFGVSMGTFMFHGAIVSSIPLELEEAAKIDGASRMKIYRSVVLPLLKPTVVTLVIIDSLAIWNDYLLPSLIINKPGWQTLPLKTYLFFGQFAKRWDLASAGLIMCIIPIIIFYLCCQKYIVKGITDGAIK